MKVLITGAHGFSARHLFESLSKDPSLEIFQLDIDKCDLSQYETTKKWIHSIAPNQIYHLAGSFTNIYETDYQNNVLSTKNILDSLVSLNIQCRVLLVGSAAEYGVPSTNPICENAPLAPVSIYGLTKVFQTFLMDHYSSLYGLDLVMARTFNLMGKGLSKNLFIGKVYDQIDRYKKGEISKITLGNLSAERDYIDIKEAMLAYQKIMNKGLKGATYNVGSGRRTEMAHLLKEILEEHGLSMDVVEKKKMPLPKVSQIFANTEKLSSLQ